MWARRPRLPCTSHGPGRNRTCDLGIKSVAAREYWPKGVVEPNQLGSTRVLWGGIVDFLLTHPVARSDNALAVAATAS